MRKSPRRGRDGIGRRRMALALEEGLAGRIYGYRDYCAMRQFNCGYWVNGRQLADLRRVLGHVGSFTSGFVGMYVGFCFVGMYVGFVGFVGFLSRFWACGAHLRFERVAGKAEVAGKEEVAVRLFCFLVHRVSFVRSWHAECQCT